MNMKVKDVVVPINNTVLRSGCSFYDKAVVASVEPFVLISEEGDMKWSATVEKENFEVIGVANRKTWRNVQKRIKRTGI